MNPKLPYIGWQACEKRFYLDALPITTEQALTHWREGTATFGKFAAKRMRFLTHEWYGCRRIRAVFIGPRKFRPYLHSLN